MDGLIRNGGYPIVVSPSRVRADGMVRSQDVNRDEFLADIWVEVKPAPEHWIVHE